MHDCHHYFLPKMLLFVSNLKGFSKSMEHRKWAEIVVRTFQVEKSISKCPKIGKYNSDAEKD